MNRDFLLNRCIHHFKSDLINNMDHMRISDTEPSSVILSQTNLQIMSMEMLNSFNTCSSRLKFLFFVTINFLGEKCVFYNL